jgi:hypothetical protein
MKAPKAPKAPKAAGSPISLPKFTPPSFSLPSSGAAPEGVNPLAGLAAGAALGLVPAGALIALRVWITSRRS